MGLEGHANTANVRQEPNCNPTAAAAADRCQPPPGYAAAAGLSADDSQRRAQQILSCLGQPPYRPVTVVWEDVGDLDPDRNWTTLQSVQQSEPCYCISRGYVIRCTLERLWLARDIGPDPDDSIGAVLQIPLGCVRILWLDDDADSQPLVYDPDAVGQWAAAIYTVLSGRPPLTEGT